MNLTNASTHPTFNVPAEQPEPDWCVLVLWENEDERELKGIWGPYTDFRHAEIALVELRQWPLDGFWDVRRLNKFVARKAGNPPNSTQMWSWGGTDAIRTTA